MKRGQIDDILCVGKTSLQDFSRDELELLVLKMHDDMKFLRERIAILEKRNRELETELAKAKKNSTNSSKPPSSDITKPDRPSSGGGKRSIGGQPGHERHERESFPPEKVDCVRHHTAETCPDCGGKMKRAKDPSFIQQQVDLVEKPYVVTEHRAYDSRCNHCGKLAYATLPEDIVQAGLFAPRLTAMVGWLKSQGRMSYAAIAEWLGDCMGMPVSSGFLAKVAQKTSAALSKPYEEMAQSLTRESYLNVDETGHPGGKRDFWMWVYSAKTFTVFHIAPSRSARELKRLLGRKFKGVLGCDYFSAYRKFLRLWKVAVQFCMAHLIRDVKFVAGLPDQAASRYGRKLLAGLCRLFRIWHRKGIMPRDEFVRRMKKARDEFLTTVRRAPWSTEAQNLAKRFREHASEYFRFVTTEGVEPTNNKAERDLRPVVMDRRLTQGTRSDRGRRWSERIWSCSATCRKQNRSFYKYLCEAIQAHFQNLPAPSLLLSVP